ncbi:hypothetical protein PsYK624_118210 [Phanerochaete sordida]|uniref:Uncharacterized protein n=1 Tax=Phanerochaete sordida TaxID=48140 RepID=A0A9P3LHS4_9APHY|nr:hypothetical protein PsYK624_118210 [Phanerochaete sordida]
MVLSSALSIPLSRVGIWRLEEKPWSRIEPVRRVLRSKLDFNADRYTLIDFIAQATSEQPEAPVPAVYSYLHVLDEISARPFEPLILPVEGDAPLTVDIVTAAQFFEAHVSEKYAECPVAFQDVLFARLERTLAESTISRTYVIVLSSITAAWEKVQELADSIASETPLVSVATLEQIISNLEMVLEGVRVQERELIRTWYLTIPPDVAIGEERLTEWFTLLDVIADWEYDSECAERLREAAGDFAAYFYERLREMERAYERELAECARTGETGSYTTISNS